MNVCQQMPTTLSPGILADAPALIESVFPAQKVSFEAQREHKANLGQTLTGLGSYWKGLKPLILVRAIVLGSLLRQRCIDAGMNHHIAKPVDPAELFETLLKWLEKAK